MCYTLCINSYRHAHWPPRWVYTLMCYMLFPLVHPPMQSRNLSEALLTTLLKAFRLPRIPFLCQQHLHAFHIPISNALLWCSHLIQPISPPHFVLSSAHSFSQHHHFIFPLVFPLPVLPVFFPPSAWACLRFPSILFSSLFKIYLFDYICLNSTSLWCHVLPFFKWIWLFTNFHPLQLYRRACLVSLKTESVFIKGYRWLKTFPNVRRAIFSLHSFSVLVKSHQRPQTNSHQTKLLYF